MRLLNFVLVAVSRSLAGFQVHGQLFAGIFDLGIGLRDVVRSGWSFDSVIQG
jgi:hypothetical protein